MYPGYNTITTTTPGLWWHGGVRKGRFQQSDTTHSGTGEKEAPNINVVGNIEVRLFGISNSTYEKWFRIILVAFWQFSKT
jgi:hypothetical protein